MDMTDPFATVTPTLDGPVLSVLAGTSHSLSARDIARLVRRGSWSGVRRTLHRLAAQGIVRVEEAGGAHLYQLNRRHLAAPAIERLADLRGALVRQLRTEIGAWPIAARHASLFGSTARGDSDTASDVDLLVVRSADIHEDDPAWRAQLEALAADVYDWTGNHAGISEVVDDEIRRVAESPAGRSMRDEAVLLAGAPLRQLFPATGVA